MPLAEGTSARIAAKFYASGAITPGAGPDPASEPGASGGQILRRVGATLTLSKDTYQSGEIRSDRQIGDFRHGVKRVQGAINGELSPLTYADFFEAACRADWSASAVSKSNTELTSAAADNATSKFTFGGGNPVTEGLRVGMIVRFANLSEAGNNGRNFLILAFGGASNREVTVYPAPTTHTADTSFTVASVGRMLTVPSTGHVSRKVAIEIYNEDVDVARLFTECRVGGFNIQLPATGMSTVDFEMMGRDMVLFEAGDAPFFGSPAAATTTGLLAAVNGLLRIGGQTVAVITGASVQMQLSPSADPVVGSNLVPEIFLGRANVTGQLTAFFDSPDLIESFIDEDEIELMLYLTTSSAADTPAMVLYLPRIKLGGADLQTQGEGGQSITLPFQALKYEGAAPGVEQTTFLMFDTAVS
jgi:hypothetical protein